MTLAQIAVQPGVDLEPLASFIASQLELPSAALADYAAREQTMTDHAREIGAALGLRPPGRADLGMMIEAAASAAWSTDKGAAIVGTVVAALREKAIMLPVPATIERAGITGRATARKRVHDALLNGLGVEQLAALDELLTLDPQTGFTRPTKLRTIPSGPKPDHVFPRDTTLHAPNFASGPDDAAFDTKRRTLHRSNQEQLSANLRISCDIVLLRSERWVLQPRGSRRWRSCTTRPDASPT